MLLYSDADREINYWDQILKYNKEIPVTQQYKSQFNKVLTILHKQQNKDTNRIRHSPLWCPTALYFTALQITALHCTALHCTALDFVCCSTPVHTVVLYNNCSVHQPLLYICELLRTAPLPLLSLSMTTSLPPLFSQANTNCTPRRGGMRSGGE